LLALRHLSWLGQRLVGEGGRRLLLRDRISGVRFLGDVLVVLLREKVFHGCCASLAPGRSFGSSKDIFVVWFG